MFEGRRRFSVLSLLVVVSLLGSLFVVEVASAKTSKAQKRAITKKLNRAVKKNPKVIQKRWFLKQASIVNYELPSTIRLVPAANQAGDPVAADSQPGGADVASLDLGPSLGSRTVGLGGKVRATIKFNDAFDSGAIGDVRVDLPSGAGTELLTTSVPLLTNIDVTDDPGGMNETQTILVDSTCSGGTFTLDFNGQVTAGIACGASGTAVDTALEALSNIGAGEVYVAGPVPTALPFPASAYVVMFTGTLGNTNVTQLIIDGTGLTGGTLVASAPRQQGEANSAGGGCSNFVGDNTGTDVDLPSALSTDYDAGDVNNVGAGPFSPEVGATAGDVVLRTGPLSLDVAAPGTVDLPASSEDVTLGRSGGRANLFGSPVNGLTAGNSVDVTVNLATSINSIAREVDGSYPGAAGGVDETAGNIAAYFNCRQAWTGAVDNWLTGINLTGSLKIAPAITADGKLRIAKVSLSTPAGKEAKIAVAACLSPYKLYANGFDFTALALPADPVYPDAPSLIGGSAAFFNPLIAINPQAVGAAPSAACNASSPALNRAPFNVAPVPGANPLDAGAAVAVAGDLSVTNLTAEVLIGNV